MQEHARQVVVADSSKLGRVHVCAIGKIHLIITDTGALQEQLQIFKDHGADILCVWPAR